MASKSHQGATDVTPSNCMGDANLVCAFRGTSNSTSTQKHSAFSLIELLVTVAVISILVTVSAPSFVKSFEARHLVSATEDLYSFLQQARMESLSRSKLIYFNLSGQGTNNWSYGIKADTQCDPTQTSNINASACVLVIDDGDDIFNPGDDNVLNRIEASQYKNISLKSSLAAVSFDPKRGTVNENLELVISSDSDLSTKITLSLLGNISICSDQLNDYQRCSG